MCNICGVVDILFPNFYGYTCANLAYVLVYSLRLFVVVYKLVMFMVCY